MGERGQVVFGQRSGATDSALAALLALLGPSIGPSLAYQAFPAVKVLE
jgi:hypothetical protein